MLIIHNKKFKFSKKTWAKPGRNYSSLYTLSPEENNIVLYTTFTNSNISF